MMGGSDYRLKIIEMSVSCWVLSSQLKNYLCLLHSHGGEEGGRDGVVIYYG